VVGGIVSSQQMVQPSRVTEPSVVHVNDEDAPTTTLAGPVVPQNL